MGNQKDETPTERAYRDGGSGEGGFFIRRSGANDQIWLCRISTFFLHFPAFSCILLHLLDLLHLLPFAVF